MFHLLEFLIGLCFVHSMVMFDTFMVTLCIAITGQLNMIATAYENFAHNHANDRFRSGKCFLHKCTISRDLRFIFKKHGTFKIVAVNYIDVNNGKKERTYSFKSLTSATVIYNKHIILIFLMVFLDSDLK